MLLKCYRTGDANDPETYVAAVAAVLSHYPEQVITAVTHPVSGLPSNGKGWLPTVKEVSDACKAEMEPIAQNEARLKRIREQMEMRDRMDAGEKPTYAELKAKYGENWGISDIDPVKPKEPHPKSYKAMTLEQVIEHYKTHDLQFKPKEQKQ